MIMAGKYWVSVPIIFNLVHCVLCIAKESFRGESLDVTVGRVVDHVRHPKKRNVPPPTQSLPSPLLFTLARLAC